MRRSAAVFAADRAEARRPGAQYRCSSASVTPENSVQMRKERFPLQRTDAACGEDGDQPRGLKTQGREAVARDVERKL